MKFEKKIGWNPLCDQPYVISDKAVKKRIYRYAFWNYLKQLAINIIIFPIAALSLALFYLLGAKRQTVSSQNFFGMGVNPHPKVSTPKIVDMVEELGVDDVLIRIPLHDIENLDVYVDFIAAFAHKNIMINIMQDRRHVEDANLLKDSINKIFTACQPYCQRYQIGNAINRKKWAFFTMREYLEFYRTVQTIRDESFSEFKLIGSSVIDFEYFYSISSLFNFFKIRYDQFNSLLYVDRRGAPESGQRTVFLFDFLKK